MEIKIASKVVQDIKVSSKSKNRFIQISQLSDHPIYFTPEDAKNVILGIMQAYKELTGKEFNKDDANETI